MKTIASILQVTKKFQVRQKALQLLAMLTHTYIPVLKKPRKERAENPRQAGLHSEL